MQKMRVEWSKERLLEFHGLQNKDYGLWIRCMHVNPILHTDRFENQTLALTKYTAKYYFGKKIQLFV